MVLVETDLERLIVNDGVDITGQMIQDLERQISKWLLGALDPFAGVGLCECNTKIFSNSLGLACFGRCRDVNIGCFGECVKELDALAEIGVVDTRLKSKPVLHRTCKGVEQV